MIERPLSVAATTLAVALSSVVLALRPAAASTPEPVSIVGRYQSKGDATKSVTITSVAPGVFRAVAETWEGVGLFLGTSYWGVFRDQPLRGSPGRRGTHNGTLRGDGSLAVRVEYADGGGKGVEVVWTPQGEGVPPGVPRLLVPNLEAPAPSDLPALGEYVYVEELPEAVKKVAPHYPDNTGILQVEGTVLVQALVGKDGRVKDTKVIQSIPALDEVAVEAVRQWEFRPAMAKGKPVAVWVAIPLKFSVH